MTRDQIRQIVLAYVQPLSRASVEKVTGLKAKLANVIPFGTADNFQVAQPFGVSSRPPKGVLAYFLNLFGASQNGIVLSYLHVKRPVPSTDGEVIFYCTDASDGSVPIQIILKANGTLRMQVSSKVEVVCDNIELGGDQLEKILNGETFQTFFNQHKHQGNLGVPTGPPIIPSDASHLSTVVKAKK